MGDGKVDRKRRATAGQPAVAHGLDLGAAKQPIVQPIRRTPGPVPTPRSKKSSPRAGARSAPPARRATFEGPAATRAADRVVEQVVSQPALSRVAQRLFERRARAAAESVAIASSPTPSGSGAASARSTASFEPLTPPGLDLPAPPRAPRSRHERPAPQGGPGEHAPGRSARRPSRSPRSNEGRRTEDGLERSGAAGGTGSSRAARRVRFTA